MNFTNRVLKNINDLHNLNTVHHLFSYPKLILQLDPKNIDIFDVLNNDFNTFAFDYVIKDKIIHDDSIWILLTSGDITCINLSNNLRIDVEKPNYLFQGIKSDNNLLYFITDGGDTYSVKPNISSTHNPLEFIKILTKNIYIDAKIISQNGCELFLKDGSLFAKCHITGVMRKFFADITLKKYVIWDSLIILDNQSSMWVVDFENAQVQFKFADKEAVYFALTTYGNNFYYLFSKNDEVSICCCHHIEQPIGKIISTPQQLLKTDYAQENLKTELKSLAQSINSNADPFQIIPDLQRLIIAIEDCSFLFEVIISICARNLNYKPMLYLLHNKVVSSSHSELLEMLHDALIKTELMEYINFKGVTYYNNSNLYDQNYKQLCVTFVSQSDFDLASICCLKYSESKLNITADDFSEILCSIPQSIKMAALLIWLKHFLPPLLYQNPFFIDLLVRWTMERVFLLEKSGYWPKIGVKFTKEIMCVVSNSFETIQIHPVSLEDLETLCSRVNHIIELNEKYKIKMSLKEMSSQSANEVALIMLRRCYTEDLLNFLDSYLTSYAIQNSFELDEILHLYIINEASSGGGVIDGERLEILLKSFRSLTKRLDCLLQVLKVLDVPWNTLITQLATEAAASTVKGLTVTDADSAIAQEIYKELNYANLKIVLNKYNFPVSFQDYRLVLHCIINSSNTDLDDLKTITTIMPAYKNYSNLLYISKCLDESEVRKALIYYENLIKKERKFLLKSVSQKFEQIVTGHKECAVIEKNYLDFLKGTLDLNKIEVTELENLYNLKNSFQIKLSKNTLYIEKLCQLESSKWIKSDTVIASSSRGRYLVTLLNPLADKKNNINTILSNVSTTNDVRKCVESFLSSDITRSHETLRKFEDGKDLSLLLGSCQILIEMINVCYEEHLDYLLKILSILNSLVNVNVVMKNLAVAWKYHYFYLPMSSVSVINELISFHNSDDKYLDNVSQHMKKCDVLSSKIITTILGKLNYSMDSNKYFDLKCTIIKKLLQRVLVFQTFDEVWFLNLLLILSTSHAKDNRIWIEELLNPQHENMSTNLTLFLSHPIMQKTFCYENISLGSPIMYTPQSLFKSKLNIDLKDIILPDITEDTMDSRLILFHVLKQNPNVGLEWISKVCHILDIKISDALTLQLLALFTTWELKYKIVEDDLGCKHLFCENDEKNLSEKAFAILNDIGNQKMLKEILNDLWVNSEVSIYGQLITINPYYYEIYICIYHLLFSNNTVKSRNMKEYYLLFFLKNYRRRGMPKQYEYEYFSVKGIFPDIGFYRLPFHLFMREDMWSKFKSEITLESYELWLPAVTLLCLSDDTQISKDMICSNALKQTMTARTQYKIDLESKEKESWRIATKEEPLLRAAHKCVRHIANMEWAGACLFYMLQGCAYGADRVAAAQLCYRFAQRWAEVQPQSRAVRQMQHQHLTLSTRHALHKIDWACEEFLKLSTEPAQLICNMYLHPQLGEKSSKHNVNRAINEIADKHNINISSLRIQILESILDNSTGNSKNMTSLSDSALMTAKYILKATCPKMGAIYLSRIAFDDECEFNKCKKLRALQCLLSVVNTDTAIKVTNRKRDVLWTSLLELLYIANLERVDMPWAVAPFVQNREHGIEQILQNMSGNLEAMKLIAELARRFGNLKIISSLIPNLLSAGLHDELIPLLLKMSLANSKTIYTAWRTILLTPFQRADHPITDYQKRKCIDTINLLPVCSIIKEEDLLEIWKNCVRCKIIGIGCLVLPYMTYKTRHAITESYERRNLIASLKNLQTDSYLVSSSMHVIESMASKIYR